MGEIFGFIIFRVFLNFIEASIRWIYGSIWRTIFKKPKFSFKEYLNGLKKSSDYYDDLAHKGNNIVIAFIFFFIVATIIIKFNI